MFVIRHDRRGTGCGRSTRDVMVFHQGITTRPGSNIHHPIRISGCRSRGMIVHFNWNKGCNKGTGNVLQFLFRHTGTGSSNPLNGLHHQVGPPFAGHGRFGVLSIDNFRSFVNFFRGISRNDAVPDPHALQTCFHVLIHENLQIKEIGNALPSITVVQKVQPFANNDIMSCPIKHVSIRFRITSTMIETRQFDDAFAVGILADAYQIAAQTGRIKGIRCPASINGGFAVGEMRPEVFNGIMIPIVWGNRRHQTVSFFQ
mmetsp:Transcript_1910/g.4188  ORF Transcript_1910/g.4188 Transcript_1910/m.4188 type:complete len:258 (-) Transcript_1910:91-864(-)|eukprot:scaffold4825_cov153-Amphora_coffeaeformis.AAC.6